MHHCFQGQGPLTISWWPLAMVPKPLESSNSIFGTSCCRTIEKKYNLFSKFPCMFLNSNYLFPVWILIVLISDYWYVPPGVSRKNILFQKSFWRFTVKINCSEWSQNFCKFSAISLEVQKVFSITATIYRVEEKKYHKIHGGYLTMGQHSNAT